jgi:hypothetical protein
VRFPVGILLGASLTVCGCATTSDSNRGAARPVAPGVTWTPAAPTPKAPAKPAGPEVVPIHVPKGRIISVRPELRFVVVDFSLESLPPEGQRLSVYRAGLKVGEIKISGPARGSNTVADISAGEAQVGDEVRPD